MITFHTIVRGFEGEFDHIQRNAIGSWMHLATETGLAQPEVLLFGEDEPGAMDVAMELGLMIFPLERNERGIPLVSYPIEISRSVSLHTTRCLINADILLLSGFLDAVAYVKERFPQFLMIGRRFNLDLGRLLEFGDNWEEDLKREVQERGELAGKKYIDYFCYRGNFWGEIPPFAVGRTSWDNWLVWKARDAGVPVIDASDLAPCIHQNHYKRRVSVETDANRAMLTRSIGSFTVYGFANVTHRIEEDGEIVKL
jgi:hypothetical protein